MSCNDFCGNVVIVSKMKKMCRENFGILVIFCEEKRAKKVRILD